MGEPVRIPKDPDARARLAEMAGLTDDERLALDKWCDTQATEDEARRRTGLERSEPCPKCGGWEGLSCDVCAPTQAPDYHDEMSMYCARGEHAPCLAAWEWWECPCHCHTAARSGSDQQGGPT